MDSFSVRVQWQRCPVLINNPLRVSPSGLQIVSEGFLPLSGLSLLNATEGPLVTNALWEFLGGIHQLEGFYENNSSVIDLKYHFTHASSSLVQQIRSNIYFSVHLKKGFWLCEYGHSSGYLYSQMLVSGLSLELSCKSSFLFELPR